MEGGKWVKLAAIGDGVGRWERKGMAHYAMPVLSRLWADSTHTLSMNALGTTPVKQHTDTHLSWLIKCLVKKSISSHYIIYTIM